MIVMNKVWLLHGVWIAAAVVSFFVGLRFPAGEGIGKTGTAQPTAQSLLFAAYEGEVIAPAQSGRSETHGSAERVAAEIAFTLSGES